MNNGVKRNPASGDEHKRTSSLHLKNVLKSFDPKSVKTPKNLVDNFSEKEIQEDQKKIRKK